MKLPMTASQINEFVVGYDYMDYFSFHEYLIELVDNKFIEKYKEKGNTLYSITKSGEDTLLYFIKHIPKAIRDEIKEYTLKNKRKIQSEFEVSANWHMNSENDYVVECAVYEGNLTLMNIKVSVVSEEAAKLICNNWKSNVNSLYGNILNALVKPKKTDN